MQRIIEYFKELPRLLQIYSFTGLLAVGGFGYSGFIGHKWFNSTSVTKETTTGPRTHGYYRPLYLHK